MHKNMTFYSHFFIKVAVNKSKAYSFLIFGMMYLQKEKKKEIWLSPMTKAPKPTEKSKKQVDNTKTPPKTSITQRLRTDLGRSVGVTIATQLVWLNRFTGSQPSH